ncbi:glycosyltransferase family 2 protein [Streptomyces sp. NPDC088400]|uniref:glycosyltransferase family 2 protein n=1 Tax=Streptomyces sp. NPDC088400 TaxID=3365861 RepID=UPI003811182D
MEFQPLVSIIVPNYNYERTLGLCLSAIQDQSYPKTEIIVVDDCSTDGSVAVAERFGVPVLRTPGNSGVAAARNLGARQARGEVLFFVDSDVALAPDAVANAVALLGGDAAMGSVCGIYEPEPLIRDSLVEEYRSLQAHYWRASSEGPVSFGFFSLGAIRADVFAELGPFNDRLWQTEEVDYGNRLSQRYTLWLSNDVRGRHDDDHEMWPLMRKLFRRGRLRVPLYARRRRFAQGFETASRAWGSLAALGSVAALALPPLFGVAWAVVPALLLLMSLLSDAGMYGYVLRRRGPFFLLYFMGAHFLVNLSIAAGAGAGALQWLASGAFRQLYDAGQEPLRGSA